MCCITLHLYIGFSFNLLSLFILESWNFFFNFTYSSIVTNFCNLWCPTLFLLLLFFYIEYPIIGHEKVDEFQFLMAGTNRSPIH